MQKILTVTSPWLFTGPLYYLKLSYEEAPSTHYSDSALAREVLFRTVHTLEKKAGNRASPEAAQFTSKIRKIQQSPKKQTQVQVDPEISLGLSRTKIQQGGDRSQDGNSY